MPKESWEPKPAASGGGRRRGRWLGRIVWTAAVLALLAWFVWLLITPFVHPRTHLVLLSGDVISVDASPTAVPADYVTQDLRELLALTDVLHQGLLDQRAAPLVLGSLSSADEMQRLAERLNERVTGRGDVVLIYVSAHGLTQDSDAWLLASGADPAAPLGGRYRLANLLAQLRQCRAATKVLLLEAGRIDYDPLRGLLDNDFPCRLAEQVHELGDPSLWVLVSHGAAQRSHVSPALRQSVFGYFVATGLSGAADADGSRAVDLGELNNFVSTGVSGWVRHMTAGAAAQTPILLWGGGRVSPSRSLPTLVAVPKRAAGEAPSGKLDHSRSVAKAQTTAGATGELQDQSRRELESLISRSVVRSTPQGRFGQFINEKVQSLLAQARSGGEQPAEQPPPAPAGPAAPKTGDAAPPDKAGTAAEKAGKAAAPTEPKGQPAAAKAEVAKQQPAAEKAASPAASPEATAEPAVTAAELAALAAQLERAWQLRDELLTPDRPAARPVDYAPHLWRELETRLLVHDRRLRTGYVRSADEIAAPLKELIQTLDAIAAPTPPAALAPDSLAARINAARPARALANVEARSLAVLERIAADGGPPLAAELAGLAAQLDRIIDSGNRADLEAFAKTVTPDHERYFELRIARWLAERSELDYRLVQLLLAATRASGQAAAGLRPHATGGEMLTIEQADRQRLAAERQLLAAGLAADRDALIAALTQALEAYQAALASQAAQRAAQRLAADVWRALPHYLAWNAASSAPTTAELRTLLARLDTLENLLSGSRSATADDIRSASAALAQARQQIERDLDLVAIEQLLAPPITPGESWRIELLLETPLPSAPVRTALAALLPQIDAALAAQVPQPEPLSPAARDNGVRQDDERFFARARLQQQTCDIALRGVANPDRDALAAALATRASQTESLADQRGYAETGLADLLLGLPARIEREAALDADLSLAAGREARLARLHAWQRASRLMDARTIAMAGGSPAASLHNAAAYDLLAWLRQRAQRAGEDAPPQEAAYQQQIAAVYRSAAAAIPQQPPLDFGPALPIEIAGPDRVVLTYEKQQSVELSIRNLAAAPVRVWLAGEWNAELVALGGGLAQSIYPWPELVDASGRPAAEMLASVRPSLELAANQTLRLPLVIERRQASLYAPHLVLRVLTEQHIARHDVAIALPPPEDISLAVAGPAGRWTPQAGGLSLHPFPNRLNTFALRLANGKPLDRKVDALLLPLLSDPPHELPDGPLTAADAARLRQELSLGAVVGEAKAIALPGSGAPVGVLLVPPKTEPPPAPAPANGKSAPAAAPKSDKPPPVPLTNGLVLIVTDQADQRQSFKWLRIEPQRPQRYLRPQVRYRVARERIEVSVTAIDRSLLPDGGARIHADVLEPLPADAERQLDAVLRPEDAEARLHVEVPAAAGRVVTLRLSVDGYPRAIYYRVPCSGETSDIAEDLDLLAARIVELPQGTVYKPPLATIPVRIELDAPGSALNNPPLRALVGIDRNRDRELAGDETLVLATDRQVAAALVEIDKTGQLVVSSAVGDFTLDLPTASLNSGRVNVLVQAILGDREAWSEPVEIVFDDQPPRASAIELRPAGAAIIGQDLLVSALCDDQGLSGVAKMEVAIDLERSGKFSATAMPVAGALSDDGRWSAKLPTAGLASGSYNILVRAIDRAGNAGESIRTTANLLTQAEVDAKKARDNSADITGTVVYGNQPQAGVTVSLVADSGAPPPPAGKGKTEPPPPLATATTDASGRFRFAKVTPGKYLVTATALVRNKNRRADAPIVFQTPAEVQPVSLSLK